MSRDDIIRMAKEAGMTRGLIRIPAEHPGNNEILPGYGFSSGNLERFAALVAAHEREECAKLCDQIEDHNWKLYKNGPSGTLRNPHIEGISDGAGYCATAVRARRTT